MSKKGKLVDWLNSWPVGQIDTTLVGQEISKVGSALRADLVGFEIKTATRAVLESIFRPRLSGTKFGCSGSGAGTG